jgi:hypothetical protein
MSELAHAAAGWPVKSTPARLDQRPLQASTHSGPGTVARLPSGQPIVGSCLWFVCQTACQPGGTGRSNAQAQLHDQLHVHVARYRAVNGLALWSQSSLISVASGGFEPTLADRGARYPFIIAFDHAAISRPGYQPYWWRIPSASGPPRDDATTEGRGEGGRWTGGWPRSPLARGPLLAVLGRLRCWIPGPSVDDSWNRSGQGRRAPIASGQKIFSPALGRLADRK